MKRTTEHCRRNIALILSGLVLSALLFSSCASAPETPSFMEGEYETQEEFYEAAVEQLSQRAGTLDSAMNMSETSNDSELLDRISELMATEEKYEELLSSMAVMEESLSAAEELNDRLSDSLNRAELAQSVLRSTQTTLPQDTERSLQAEEILSTDSRQAEEGINTDPRQVAAEISADPRQVAAEISADPRQVAAEISAAPRVETIVLTGTVYSPESIGRSEPQLLGGSNIVLQKDSLGTIYLSHRGRGQFSDETTYTEIQQPAGSNPSLYLVMQVEKELSEQAFEILGIDISLSGNFSYNLPVPEKRERLRNSRIQLDRIYIPLNQELLQALGTMVRQARGTFTLMGRYEELDYIINRENAPQFQEVISTYLEMRTSS